MPSVQELYELWAGDSNLREELNRSLGPRGPEWLFELFATLGPKPGQTLVDVGARDAKHAIRLAQEHDLRVTALDPLPLHCELAREAIAESNADVAVVEGRAEQLPFADGEVDWIWCRDVLSHADVDAALREFARVLKPGGAAVVFVTVPTHLLEPRETAALADAAALELHDADGIEDAAEAAGLSLRQVERLGSEWREQRLEDREWDGTAELLRIARLVRNRDELVAEHGAAAIDAAWGGLVWGVYQVLGKLEPTVYVWEQRA